MATPMIPLRHYCWKAAFRDIALPTSGRRCRSSLASIGELRARLPSDLPSCFLSQLPDRLQPRTVKKPLRIFQSPPRDPSKIFKDPVAAVTESQLAILDPSGERKTLFSRKNKDAAKVGDILLIRFKSGDPFSGVCLNIRHRGVDTAILLRNQLTRVGVEMWVKIFSPSVEGIEVVQRREKRARRARLYYMRKPEHDMGSVQNIVYQYQRQRASFGAVDRRGRSGIGSKAKKR